MQEIRREEEEKKMREKILQALKTEKYIYMYAQKRQRTKRFFCKICLFNVLLIDDNTQSLFGIFLKVLNVQLIVVRKKFMF